jgi:hypothetical protein
LFSSWPKNSGGGRRPGAEPPYREDSATLEDSGPLFEERHHAFLEVARAAALALQLPFQQKLFLSELPKLACSACFTRL